MDTPSSSVNLIDDSTISDAPQQSVSEDAALDAADKTEKSYLAHTMTAPDISNGEDVVKEPMKQDNQLESMPTNSSIENVTKLQLIGQSNLNNNNHHQHQESNIKLKRCKHGRIIIKDLSKKKLVHNENSSANDLDQEQRSIDLERRVESDCQQLDVTTDSIATEHSVESPFDKCIASPTPTKSPGAISPSSHSPEGLPRQPLSPPIDETISIEVKQKVTQKPSKGSSEFSMSFDRHHSSNRSRRSRSNSRSRSRTRSRSHSRSRGDRRSPSPRRRSRYSRSPSPRMRTSSRERATSPHRYSSRSPRRQARSPSTRRRNRGSSRRKNRYRSSNNYRGEHSRSRSPRRRRRTSRSHSRSSSSREEEFSSSNRVRREESRSPDRQQYRNDRYSSHDRHSRRKDTYLDRKNSSKVTREDCKLRADTLDSGVGDNFNSSSNQHTSNETQSSTKPIDSSGNVGHLHTRRPQTSHNISSQQISPKISTVTKDATSPRDISTARSPATPSNDSVSSDIYDPEGPVILISPGDSPPLSPVNNAAFSKELYQPNNDKNGDDDVPSSAVQLNQQEKYLQKLNRQERVIEEVKMSLRPYYQNRTIDKEQYKDVLRRAVPKICHSKKGEINPNKIRTLVDAYVKKMKHHRD